jgi:hypothetical protein
MGYMTSLKLNGAYSWWNDVHWVPGGFFLGRTGLTRLVRPWQFTAGYAYGRLPVSTITHGLPRTEHRPWAQAQAVMPLARSLVFVTRVRYDARFRQEVRQSELLKSYSLTHRLRWMVTCRKFLFADKNRDWKPFVALSNEVLLNVGPRASRFDQNRVLLMVGAQREGIQLQLGYMNRFVKTGVDRFVQNHMAVVWITHAFVWKKSPREINTEMDGE